jgi:hypothetical protein
MIISEGTRVERVRHQGIGSQIAEQEVVGLEGELMKVGLPATFPQHLPTQQR